jgi:hypothetical protein
MHVCQVHAHLLYTPAGPLSITSTGPLGPGWHLGLSDTTSSDASTSVVASASAGPAQSLAVSVFNSGTGITTSSMISSIRLNPDITDPQVVAFLQAHLVGISTPVNVQLCLLMYIILGHIPFCVHYFARLFGQAVEG